MNVFGNLKTGTAAACPRVRIFYLIFLFIAVKRNMSTPLKVKSQM